MEHLLTGVLRLRLLAVLLLLVTGCGKGLPPPAESGKAREALQTALDAWKQGAKPEALHGRSPAIYFNEPRWHQGRRLLDYRIEPDSEQRHGQGLRYSVTLSLAGAGGRKVRKQALYQIDTSPQMVIVPADR